MSYKAIISDLDGTLLNEDGKITQYTKEIIKKVSEKGILFFIATGRCFETAYKIKEQLEVKCYLVTSNGAEIYNEKGEQILSEYIPPKIVEELVKYQVDSKFERYIVSEDIFYKEVGNDFDDGSVTYKSVEFENFSKEKVINFYYKRKDKKSLMELEKELLKKFGNKLNICISTEERLDLMKKDVSKASGIKKVLESIGIEMKETISFGDQLNDLEMLVSSGKGFIMENGAEELKQRFSQGEIIGTNIENSVAKKIQELFKLNSRIDK